MCNRAAQLQTAAQLAEALGAEFFNVGEAGITLPRRRIDPKSALPVVTNESDHLQAQDATWGMPFPGSTWNARDDRLLESPAWSKMVGQPSHHAVAVLSHVFEPFGKHALEAIGESAARELVDRDAIARAKAGKTSWHGIQRADGAPILIPCLVTEADGKVWATMVTTHANEVWGRLHRPSGDPTNARQVVWLDDVRAARAWLTGNDWQALLQPCAPAAMQWYRVAPEGWDNDPFTPWRSPQAGLGAFG